MHLTFVLNEDSTQVLSRLSLKPNYEGDAPPPLPLDGALLQADLLSQTFFLVLRRSHLLLSVVAGFLGLCLLEAVHLLLECAAHRGSRAEGCTGVRYDLF